MIAWVNGDVLSIVTMKVSKITHQGVLHEETFKLKLLLSVTKRKSAF